MTTEKLENAKYILGKIEAFTTFDSIIKEEYPQVTISVQGVSGSAMVSVKSGDFLEMIRSKVKGNIEEAKKEFDQL